MFRDLESSSLSQWRRGGAILGEIEAFAKKLLQVKVVALLPIGGSRKVKMFRDLESSSCLFPLLVGDWRSVQLCLQVV